jgi:preprotein translocase subunit SecF
MADKKAGLFHRLYHGETNFNFIGRKRQWFLLSGLVMLAGIISLVTQGLNYGIEFKGGTSWEVKAPHASVSKTRDVLRPLGMADAKIQTVGGGIVRVQGPHLGVDRQQKVAEALAKLGHTSTETVSINDVGPSWGKAVTNKARTALIGFFIAISIYISARFEWKMAASAITAVIHDIIITVGVYSISRFEVTPATVVAFLTILGYSLYDTIVVFDRVEENTRGLAASGRMTYSDTVNLSMNQVLMRSLNTSLVAILPILSVLVIGAYGLGATTLKDFGLALLVGLLTGAYSSIFIASPVLAMLKERESRYAGIRQRLLSKGGGIGAPLTPAAAAAMVGPTGGGDGLGVRDDTASNARPATVAVQRQARPAGPGGAARKKGGNRPGGGKSRKKGRRR